MFFTTKLITFFVYFTLNLWLLRAWAISTLHRFSDLRTSLAFTCASKFELLLNDWNLIAGVQVDSTFYALKDPI